MWVLPVIREDGVAVRMSMQRHHTVLDLLMCCHAPCREDALHARRLVAMHGRRVLLDHELLIDVVRGAREEVRILGVQQTLDRLAAAHDDLERAVVDVGKAEDKCAQLVAQLWRATCKRGLRLRGGKRTELPRPSLFR